MDLGLTGHRALVGGGSGGLGGAIATALRAEGAAVALVARESARLTDQAARLEASAVPADLSTPDGPAAAVTGAVAALGGLDLLVVNTGGPPPGRFADLDEAAWAKAIDGTLLSTIRLIRAALPVLREGRDPAILVILSSSVREPIPGLVTSNTIRPGSPAWSRAWSTRSRRSASTPWRPAGSPPGASPSSTRHGPRPPARRSRRSSGRPSPGSRWGATATRRSWGASARSCFPRLRLMSPARSCRWTAG